MHVDFADWYCICTTGTEKNPTGELLTQRWAGVEKVAKDSEDDVLHLIRIALQKSGVSAEFLSKFKAAFKAADPTFLMSGNELELSVLAGSVLGLILEDEGEAADEAALGLLCAVGVGGDSRAWIKPFVARANGFLSERLRLLRKPAIVSPPQFQSKAIKTQIDTFVTRLSEHNAGPSSEAAKQMCEGLLQTLTSTTNAAAKAITELHRQSKLRMEETDVLWWLTAGVSRDLSKTFISLKTLAASVIAGKELADLVSPPGVLPAKSLLHHIVPTATGKVAGKPVVLHAAINATESSWRQKVVNNLKIDLVADLCPLLAAVKYSLTTDEPNGWLAAYKRAYGIDPSTSLDPVDLAHQIYRECLLAKLVARE